MTMSSFRHREHVPWTHHVHAAAGAAGEAVVASMCFNAAIILGTTVLVVPDRVQYLAVANSPEIGSSE